MSKTSLTLLSPLDAQALAESPFPEFDCCYFHLRDLPVERLPQQDIGPLLRDAPHLFAHAVRVRSVEAAACAIAQPDINIAICKVCDNSLVDQALSKLLPSAREVFQGWDERLNVKHDVVLAFNQPPRNSSAMDQHALSGVVIRRKLLSECEQTALATQLSELEHLFKSAQSDYDSGFQLEGFLRKYYPHDAHFDPLKLRMIWYPRVLSPGGGLCFPDHNYWSKPAGLEILSSIQPRFAKPLGIPVYQVQPGEVILLKGEKTTFPALHWSPACEKELGFCFLGQHAD